jgi:integrase
VTAAALKQVGVTSLLGSPNAELLAAFELHMRTARLSPVTITDRLNVAFRLARWLQPVSLLDATPKDLERFQQSFVHLARASVDIYSRHVVALYRWAVQYGYLDADPTGRMVKLRRQQGIPHPIKEQDLRRVLASSQGGLRMAYMLAAFAGLRAGEIVRLRGDDLTLDVAQPVALIDGKGGKERVVPLLPCLVAELRAAGFPRSGYVVLQPWGSPYISSRVLSINSSRLMRDLGVDATLHSCRHYFATEVVRQTKDILLVRDLLGHSSLATTQIYMASSIDGAQDRLAAFSGNASQLIQDTSKGSDLLRKPRSAPATTALYTKSVPGCRCGRCRGCSERARLSAG